MNTVDSYHENRWTDLDTGQVGEVREKNAAHVPLIGISTLSVLKGAEAFKASAENIKATSREVRLSGDTHKGRSDFTQSRPLCGDTS